TSSLWALGERLILPKFVTATPIPSGGTDSGKSISASATVSGRSSGQGGSSAPQATGWRAKFQQILEEAEKQRTIQNENRDRNSQNKSGKKPKNNGKR
ncbi:MAG: hypothetical protein RJA81_725, partial [Planctomycetota bacterium]